MADKGFTIQDILTPLGCEVVMPSFFSKKNNFQKVNFKPARKYTVFVFMLSGR